MAIWNREKIIIIFAIVVWMADLAFLITGEHPLPIINVFLTSPVISKLSYG
jgi:multisubunit Na+/H+ antiporter MnhG subunit